MMEMNCFSQHFCHNCGAALTMQPEKEAGDLFLRCLACGAKNLLGFKVSIVGCRRYEHLLREPQTEVGIAVTSH
jgi:hypothetical protein